MKAIKSDSDSDSDEQKKSSVFERKKPGMTPQKWRLKKGRQVFQENNRGVTPSVAARVSPTLVTPLPNWTVNE